MISIFLFITLSLLIATGVVSKTSSVRILARKWSSLCEKFQVHQHYTIPKLNGQFQENQLYRQVSTYLNSLTSLRDSDFTNLLSGHSNNNPNDIFFRLNDNQTVIDTFLGARLVWTNRTGLEPDSSACLVLRIRVSDKKRIFRQYFQHIATISDEIDRREKETRLHYVVSGEEARRRWRSVPFTHPASFETIVDLDGDLRTRVESDLELFARSKEFYRRHGRVWRRSFLLHGAASAGKSRLVAAIARRLRYDVYEIDAARASCGADVRSLLLETSPRSVIVVEVGDVARVSASFVDTMVSSCGDERVLVLVTDGEDEARLDPTVLRPGRIDVHVHFPLCDTFSGFKALANTYLGVKEHKLFTRVEEIFQTGGGGVLSPTEIGDIMISNRNSPSRAIKSVISALQIASSGKEPKKLSNIDSDRIGDESGELGSVYHRETSRTMREFKQLYGLLKMGSRRKDESVTNLGSTKEN